MVDEHKAAHAERQEHLVYGMFIGEVILGFQDGIVSNLGVVLGVSGAIFENRVIIISGVAAIFAEAVSMFFSQLSASMAKQEFRERELSVEREHLRTIPDHERQELREMYAQKGFQGEELERIVAKISGNPEVWLKTMEREEFTWLPPEEHAPLSDALIVGGTALVAGLIPVVPFFLLPVFSARIVSITAVIVTLFFLGALKTKFTLGHWFRKGLEMLAIGAVSSLIGYVVGILLRAVPA